MGRSLFVFLAAMVVIGLPSLAMPFDGDQALFAVLAKEMAQGAVLYVDHWEITNPGILWFYQLAGSTCGFTELGIRAFEWGYWVLFMLTTAMAIRSRHDINKFPLVPVVTVAAVYYCGGYGTPFHLTKTEGLVAFPLFAMNLLAFQATQSPRWAFGWLFLAGVASGFVLLFKVMFGLILLPLWIWWGYVFVFRGNRARVKAAGIYVAGLGLGVTLVAGLAIGYFAAHGALNAAFQALIVAPPRYLAEGQRAGANRLMASARWFIVVYSGVAAVALFAAIIRWRQTSDPVIVAIGIWLVAATGVILLQRLSWWSYHFLLLGTPLGLLAAYCWPTVVATVQAWRKHPLSRRESIALTGVAMLLFLPWIGSGLSTAMQLSRHHFGLTAGDRERFRCDVSRNYRVADEECAWLQEPTCRPGPILVVGDPLFHLKTGRPTATSINCWSLEQYPGFVRSELTRQILHRKAVYIYVDRKWFGFETLIKEQYPDVARLLETDYEVVRRMESGTWYTRRGE